MTKIFPAILLLICLLCPTSALAGVPQVGDILPAFTMDALPVEKDAVALGLEKNVPFTLADIKTPYVMLEIIGVYCSVCHKLSPSLTRLYKRLKKTKLDKQIALLGIAAGGTSMEVKYIRKKKDYIFPVVHDTKFEIYNALGEPKTPFTMIVDRQGKVLWTHLGMIPDINAFYKEIQALVQ